MTGPKGGFNCYFVISLVLTFGVNYQDLDVGENAAAKVYAVPEIKIQFTLVQISITSNLPKC